MNRGQASDIHLLVGHFRTRAESRLGKGNLHGPSPETLALLESHSWPGNVRELENLIQRALIDFGSLADIDGTRSLLAVRFQGVDSAPEPPSRGDDLTIEEVERLHIEAVLARLGGNRTNAATVLGVYRKSLYRKLKRLGIETDGGEIEC